MAIVNYFALTDAQRLIAMQGGTGWGEGEVAIDPVPVSNLSPGVGINLNDNASSYAAGEVVALAGLFVAPKRIVDDPAYLTYAPSMVAYLLTLPWCTLEEETIFAPVEM